MVVNKIDDKIKMNEMTEQKGFLRLLLTVHIFTLVKFGFWNYQDHQFRNKIKSKSLFSNTKSCKVDVKKLRVRAWFTISPTLKLLFNSLDKEKELRKKFLLKNLIRYMSNTGRNYCTRKYCCYVMHQKFGFF